MAICRYISDRPTITNEGDVVIVEFERDGEVLSLALTGHVALFMGARLTRLKSPRDAEIHNFPAEAGLN